jgi:predicted alpha/beta hydrolase family esterase
MKRFCYIIIPGILNPTDRHFAWFSIMAEDIMHKGYYKPIGIEYRYKACAVFRRARQEKRALEIANIIHRWSDYKIVLVGHSNGCDLIQRALKITSTPIETVHLIAGACESDITKTSFAKRLEDGSLKKLVCYYSRNDLVLKYAASLSRLFAFLGLGYGRLGLLGGRNVPEKIINKVVNLKFDKLGHSCYFNENNYKHILNLVLSDENKMVFKKNECKTK